MKKYILSVLLVSFLFSHNSFADTKESYIAEVKNLNSIPLREIEAFEPEKMAEILLIGTEVLSENEWDKFLHRLALINRPTHTENAMFLLKSGADVNAPTKDGTPPLRGDLHIAKAKALIESGVDLNATSLPPRLPPLNKEPATDNRLIAKAKNKIKYLCNHLL